jgi:hypothetical protein
MELRRIINAAFLFVVLYGLIIWISAPATAEAYGSAASMPFIAALVYYFLPSGSGNKPPVTCPHCGAKNASGTIKCVSCSKEIPK